MKKSLFKHLTIALVSCLAVTTFVSTTSVFAEGTGTNDGTQTQESTPQVQTAELDMELVQERRSNDANKKIYKGVSIQPNVLPRNIDYLLNFDKSILDYAFPAVDMEDKKLHVKVEYTGELGGTNPTNLTVKEWSIYDESGKFKTHFVNVTGIHFQQGEFIQYEVSAIDGSSINRITFKRSNLNDKFPLDNLMNSTLMVAGPITSSDNHTLEVRDWLPFEQGEIEQPPAEAPELFDLHGEFGNFLFQENRDTTTLYYYEFTDFDGKKYIGVIDNMKIEGDFDRYQMDGKFSIKVESIGDEGSKPIVKIHSITKQSDDFEFKTDETVSIVGNVGKRINSNGHRHTYEFEANGHTYYAVFDNEVLGNSFLTKDYTDKVLEITGVVYKEGNSVFLGVMGYRNPYASDDYGQVGEIGNTKFEQITATPVYLVSYTDTDIAYKVVTSEGLEHTFVFNKAVLKEKFPKDSVLGKQFDFLVGFNSTYKAQNSYVVMNYIATSGQGFEQDRGKFVKIVEQSSSAIIYEFESIEGGRYKVLVNRSSADVVGGPSELVGTVATIYGKENIYKNDRIFDVYMLTPVNTSHVNKQENDTVTFRGKVEKITARDNKGITLFAQNQYGQSEYLYIETEFLKDKFPASIPLEDIISHEITVTGYRMNNGVLLVKDIGFPKVPAEYPDELKPLWEDPEYFPNMKGFTGILDISDIGGSHLMLITSNDKYLLNGKPEVMKQIEDNLRNIVYLRGEYREAGAPYWTGEIKVYDIQVLDTDTNTIIKPIGEPVHDIIPDPQKPAHDTIQINELPKEYPHGKAIPEAKYFPEVPQAKDVPTGPIGK